MKRGFFFISYTKQQELKVQKVNKYPFIDKIFFFYCDDKYTVFQKYVSQLSENSLRTILASKPRL